MGAWLTVEAALPCILCQAAAHRLVPLGDITRSPIHAVVLTDPPLTERPRETEWAAAGRFT